MKQKLKRFFRKAAAFLDCRWMELTVCMLIFVLAMQIYPISVRAVSAFSNKDAVEAAAITDWGLSFGDANSQPRGNVSQKELQKYNGYFIGASEEKTLYLTFDAGYENGYTAKILDVLKEENVPATFFLVGHYIKTNPDLVKRMVEEGHIVGNHTATHPDMSKLSDIESLKAELEPVETMYKELIGSDMPKYYRPPQGKFNVSNLEQANSLGYKTVFWSLAYVDWDTKKQPSHEYAIEKLSSRVHNGAVILLHSTSQTNSEILQQIIQKWKNEGYTFKSLDDLK